MRTPLFATLLPLLACAQPKVVINGQLADDKISVRAQARRGVEEQLAREHRTESAAQINQQIDSWMCGNLSTAAYRAIRAGQMKQFAISVTDADLAAERKATSPNDERDCQFHEAHATAALAGLDALSRGEDPQAVYNRILKPTGVTPKEWQMRQDQAKTDAGNRRLIEEGACPLSWYEGTYARGDYMPQAKDHKLTAMVDQHIATSDPTFKEFVGDLPKDVTRADPNNRSISIEFAYVEKQPQAFWKQAGSRLDVVVNDPTMRSCDLSNLGAHMR